MQHLVAALRRCRAFRPMTAAEAKSIRLVQLGPLAREHERVMTAALVHEDYRAAAQHLGSMSAHAIRSSFTRDNLLLHLRLHIGNSKERSAIITGCLEASFELVFGPPDSTGGSPPPTPPPPPIALIRS